MENNKQKYAYWEGSLSIIINLLLFFLKFWAGIVSGSVAIIADAWHTLTDSVSSIIVLIGAKAAAKPPDDEHPFGHGRSELVAALLIGVLLTLVSFNFLLEAFHKFMDNTETSYGTIAITVTILSIICKEAMAQFAFWGAKKSGSQALKADGWHHRSDAISSGVILVGIFVGQYFWWIDSLLAFVVAIVIGKAAYDIFKETTSAILGENLSKNERENIEKISNKSAGHAVNASGIILHNYISRKDIIFNIHLSPDLSLEKANTIAKKIELAVAAEFDARVNIRIVTKKED